MKKRLAAVFIILLCVLLTLGGCGKARKIRELEEDARNDHRIDKPMETKKPEKEPEKEPERGKEEHAHPMDMKPVKLEPGEKYTGEFDKGGQSATVELVDNTPAEGAETDEATYYMTITGADGKENRVPSEYDAYKTEIWIADLDEDGVREIFLSQVFCSDDRSLQCWHFENGTLKALHFIRDSYGQSGAYFGGTLEDIGQGEIIIGSYVDMMGTRDATRPFVLNGYSFEAKKDSKWIFGDYYTNDEQETWNSFGLELAKPMTVELEGEETVLEAGTKLLLVSTDYEREADFVLKDGRKGVIKAERADDGWSWLIDGEPEQDWFASYLPYSG